MEYSTYMEHIKDALSAESEMMFIGENSYPADCPYGPDEWVAVQHIIWSAAIGDIKSLINNQSQFAREHEIPLRTVQDWCRGQRQCPAYLIMLLGFAKISEVYKVTTD